MHTHGKTNNHAQTGKQVANDAHTDVEGKGCDQDEGKYLNLLPCALEAFAFFQSGIHPGGRV